MKASGNGSAEQCIQNLLSITKTEIPFVRDKGLGTNYIDAVMNAEEEFTNSIEELIDTYEPRLSGDTITINYNDDGNFDAEVAVSDIYEEGSEDE